ncbi:hypothetical protein BT69DRAFT_1299519 [Atractiella rhizophila]|nr:hypothetical protein BT69DRAFT_1299519 [Atractiella rhizophila]
MPSLLKLANMQPMQRERRRKNGNSNLHFQISTLGKILCVTEKICWIVVPGAASRGSGTGSVGTSEDGFSILPVSVTTTAIWSLIKIKIRLIGLGHVEAIRLKIRGWVHGIPLLELELGLEGTGDAPWMYEMAVGVRVLQTDTQRRDGINA